MSYEELGNTIVMYQQDFDSLDIDLSRLELICDKETPTFSGFIPHRISRRLRKYVEDKGKKLKADISLIYCQADCFGIIHEMNYDVKFYRYKIKLESSPELPFVIPVPD